MKRCAKCGEENRRDETTCESCGAVFSKVDEAISSGYERNKFLARAAHLARSSDQENKGGFIASIVALAVPVVLVIFVWKTMFPIDDSASNKAGCGDGAMAFVMSQKFILRELKAPSSAKFPSSAVVTKVGECSYSVAAWVDSQNGFGAIIRSDYHVIMEASRDGRSWSARRMSIEQ